MKKVEESNQKSQRKKTITEIKTFPVPFSLDKIDEKLNTANNPSKSSKEQLINQAFKLHSKGKVSEAAKYYQHFINQGFKDYRVFSNYGVILKNNGKQKEAEQLYREAIELNPNFADAHTNLGNILRDLGNLKEAELSQRKAIKLDPGLADSYYNLGNTLRDLGNLEEAELSQRKAIQIKPDFAEAHSNLGNILRDLGNLKEAESSQRKAIKLNPNLGTAYYNLGNILETLGKIEEAIIHWKRSIELNPEENKAFISLGNYLCLNKEYELAIKYLNQNKSNSCQSLYLSCLLSLDREKEFNKKYKELYKKNVCNADIGGIIEHAKIIYKNNYDSPFCNEAIKYVLIDKVNEESFSEIHLNQLISYNKKSKKENRSQGLLTNGIQTSGNLFSLDYPFIKSIKKALEIKIDQYKQKFKDSGQGFINNWPNNYELRSWMISMKSGGFLAPHNHEYGWITGSFYLHVPKLANNNNSGNIAFTYQGPKYPPKNKVFNLTIKKIETRDICIFPSSLFHQTIPFESTEERICFVFDLIQK